MENTDNQKRFHDYYRLAYQLIDATEKDVLMEVAQMLALHVSHYESKYGKVSMDETLRPLHSVTPTDEEVGMAANATEYLSAVIGVASGLVDDVQYTSERDTKRLPSTMTVPLQCRHNAPLSVVCLSRGSAAKSGSAT
jgi:hypothetical protein